MKIAIVHDYLNQYGGAERVVETMHEIFPQAPVYTTIYDMKKMPDSFKGMDIRTSFMQKLPFIEKHFKKYLMFYPRAIESFDLKDYDLVISSSSAFGKGAIKRTGACHICYCYTPMRFVWDYENYVKKEELNFIFKKSLPLFIKRLRNWDLKTNAGVDYFIAISKNIKERIKKVYGIDADYIYPPVNISKFKIFNSLEDYFLIVSRLNSYKNIDLVISVFNKLKLKLKIVGTGPYKEKLESLIENKNIQLLGRVAESELIELYGKCRAFIFPGSEDFGIAPVEAQASGRPVIAFAAGGALETINEGISGIFFRDNSIDSLIDSIKSFLKSESQFDPKTIRSNALKFDKEVFKKKFKDYVLNKYNLLVKS